MALTTAQLNQHIVTMLFEIIQPQSSLYQIEPPDIEAFVQMLVTELEAYAAGTSAEAEAATTLLNQMAVALKGGALAVADKHLINTHWQSAVTVA